MITNGGRSGDPSFFQSPGPDLAIASGVLVVIIVGAIVIMIFSIVWGISFAFAIPITMEQNIGPIDAIKLSARAAWGNVGGVIVMAILSFLLALAGVLALCVGVFFVLPVIWVGWAFAYRQVFPDLGPNNFRSEPPPPDAYQGSFGQGM